MKKHDHDISLAPACAEIILHCLDEYLENFQAITQRAPLKFEKRDWRGRHRDANERLDLYEESMGDVVRKIEDALHELPTAKYFWKSVKEKYATLITGRHDAELAETYYNSVTRKVLSTIGLNRDVEFFHLQNPSNEIPRGAPMYRSYTIHGDTKTTIIRIFQDFHFHIPFDNIERDAEFASQEIDLRVWPLKGHERPFTIEAISYPFFRNKVAYIVGRIVINEHILPVIFPLNNRKSGLIIDTVLLEKEDIDTVFSFAYSSFHVEIRRHDALISFLKTILPDKPVSELYFSIGYKRHGKTEFYRDLHRFIHLSKEAFDIAPGKEGAVMECFTMPSYNFVFKVIKDSPGFIRSVAQTPKMITRSEVIDRYSFVCHRDRVGRMVDTQEFENLRFKEKRFSKRLLKEFETVAQNTIHIVDGYVTIDHLYVQRKVVPLPMYLQEEKDPEAVRRVILDFGFFLKDLAASGIFPSDLFNIWNYGVIQFSRVVLFDYDDVIPIEDANFKIKPKPRDSFEELFPEEEWIVASPNDFFIDEMKRFSGIPLALKGLFLSIHNDLYTLDFWQSMKRRVSRGDIVDIIPYDRRKRFVNRYRSL